VNRAVRRLALALMACFVALFVQLNLVQVVRADRYQAQPDNTRQAVRDFYRPRGAIYAADGRTALARSEPSDDRFGFQRVYPLGELFAHTVGSFSFKYGTTGIERVRNDVLTGRTAQQELLGLGDLFSDTRAVGDVITTLRPDVQTVARDALGDREGSVVALDPRTGAVLAVWSTPSYDPNRLAAHDFAAVDAARKEYLADPRKPLLANAYQERYMPGSTFKVVTAAAGIERGGVTVDTTYPVERSFVPPLTTTPIQNYRGTLCGGDFLTVFKLSCNTSFARMGLDVGAVGMVAAADAFGYNEAAPIDLPDPARSFFGDEKRFERNDPVLAQSAFGANDVQATPLQMALVAAGVANQGVIMRPYVVAETRSVSGALLERTTPRPWRTAVTPQTAAVLTTAMIGVVTDGTASCCMQLAGGTQAAAKTGTAALNPPGEPERSHAWIIAFAPAEAPTVAVAVMVKESPEVSASVGGRLAGPIARAVLDRALAGAP
jgi:peptidoglycan glycosyltransferase